MHRLRMKYSPRRGDGAEKILQNQEDYRYHIDEMWGKSYGCYSELEKKLDHIFFVYDGMEIIV